MQTAVLLKGRWAHVLHICTLSSAVNLPINLLVNVADICAVDAGSITDLVDTLSNKVLTKIMSFFVVYIACFFFKLNVNESLTYLENGHDDISSADIYIEPPIDAGSISKKDSDDEDQPSSFNHLSGKPLNASAELVLHQPTGISLPEENDKIDSEIPKPPSKQKQKNKKTEKKMDIQ